MDVEAEIDINTDSEKEDFPCFCEHGREAQIARPASD